MAIDRTLSRLTCAWPSTRRQFLRTSALGFGSLALTHLLHAEEAKGSSPTQGLHPSPPHFKPQAHAVIMLVQNGGPSQMDPFDPKAELLKRNGTVHNGTVETFQK